MPGLQTTRYAIQRREKQLDILQRAETELRGAPWFAFATKARCREEISTALKRIAECDHVITADAVQRLADIATSTLWHRAVRRIIPNKNPFGPAATAQFEEILDAAIRGHTDEEIAFGDHEFVTLAELPPVAELVTRPVIETLARNEVAHYAEVAASQVFLQEEYIDREGRRAMVIQHAESGLRAQFTINGEGLGTVFSKPYHIASIDPENPGTSTDWNQYTGLGIGLRLYTEAHRLWPDVRWNSSASTPYSGALRKKLHTQDPCVWASSGCDWCTSKLNALEIYSWGDADRAFFNNHP